MEVACTTTGVPCAWTLTAARPSLPRTRAGPAACMLALAALTPTVPGSGPTLVIVGLMSTAFALGAWARAGLYCNHQDLSPKYAAALLGECRTRAAAGRAPGVGCCRGARALRGVRTPRRNAARTRSAPHSPPSLAGPAGLTNTAGALPGVLGVTAAGYLLDTTGSWAQALFLPTACCQLFGLLIYSLLASSKRQEQWE